jgi:hypothetical protein
VNVSLLPFYGRRIHIHGGGRARWRQDAGSRAALSLAMSPAMAAAGPRRRVSPHGA